MHKYLLGIDIGSGACKITLIDSCVKDGVETCDKGSLKRTGAGRAQRFLHARTLSGEYKTYYPRPGWAEQDSAEWLKCVSSLIRGVLSEGDINPADIIAVCLSGVTHSPVLLDAKRNVIGKVIHITDSRSISQSNELKKYNEDFMKRCFNPVSPLWTISVLKWVSEEEPDMWQKIRKVIFPKDYIRYKLTGEIATDEIDAEGTLFFDPVRKTWIDDFLKLIGLKTEYLPEILKPADKAGTVTAEGQAWTGLKKGTPVYAGTTDTLLEILAAGNLKPGDCTVKLATFGRICVLADKPLSAEGLITYSYLIPGIWYPGTGTKSCAASYRWLRDEFYREHKKINSRGKKDNIFEKMDMEASGIIAGSEGLIFHPYLLGEGSPYNDSRLRGDFLGISLHHRREHFARAVLEGTCLSLLDSMNLIKKMGIKINRILKFIGGGSGSRLWTGILADVLGHCAVVPAGADASFGAAMLAGISAGLYETVEEAVRINVKAAREIEFNRDNNRLYRKKFDIYKKSKEQLTEIYHSMKEDFI